MSPNIAFSLLVFRVSCWHSVAWNSLQGLVVFSVPKKKTVEYFWLLHFISTGFRSVTYIKKETGPEPHHHLYFLVLRRRHCGHQSLVHEGLVKHFLWNQANVSSVLCLSHSLTVFLIMTICWCVVFFDLPVMCLFHVHFVSAYWYTCVWAYPC